MNYIVPAYYTHFRCKCGECRHSCCDGWPIRISMKEYYQLLGVSCSDRLRTKLDCALKLNSASGIETYAQIATDWQGLCMLHQSDGYCALQMELGEAGIPEVCRLYPRHAVRQADHNECSCSNSCEAVVELLMLCSEPMQFEAVELSIVHKFETDSILQSCNYPTEGISMLQDRSLPLSERFISLSNYLFGSDYYIQRPYLLSHAFRILPYLISYYESSISIKDYCSASQDFFGLGDPMFLTEEMSDDITKKYLATIDVLAELWPNWQILFEQLIVNHIFFNHFILAKDSIDLQDTYLSIIMMYSFLLFNLLGNLSVIDNPGKLADFVSAMFRVIEHSNFKSVAVNFYRKIKTE